MYMDDFNNDHGQPLRSKSLALVLLIIGLCTALQILFRLQ